jgi:hypothetical protein
MGKRNFSEHLNSIPIESPHPMQGDTEKMFQIYKILGENETLIDLLSKPYKDAFYLVNKFCDIIKAEYEPIPNKQSNRLFLYVMQVYSISDIFFVINATSNDVIVKTAADKLRNELSKRVIKEISKWIVMFLKWDLDRRVWKHTNDEYRLEYLSQLVSEIETEFQGKTSLLKKYINLLIDFFREKLDEAILAMSSEEVRKIEATSKGMTVLEMQDKLKTLKKNETYNEIIEEIDTSFLNLYAPAVEEYLEGYLSMTNRFDFLLYAFIEAQNDYKKILASIIDSLNNPELSYITAIKNALREKDIKKFVGILRSVFASIPNELIKNTNEAYYHIFVHLVLKLIGCDIISEYSTNLGRIDAVIELAPLIYIVEFKLTTSAEALEQIKSKQYYESYMNKGKDLYLLGLAFNSREKNIEEIFSLERLE